VGATHSKSSTSQSQPRNHQLLSNGSVNTYPQRWNPWVGPDGKHILLYGLPSNRLYIQGFHLCGYVFTEPLLSSWWFLGCDWLALDLLWVAPTHLMTLEVFPNFIRRDLWHQVHLWVSSSMPQKAEKRAHLNVQIACATQYCQPLQYYPLLKCLLMS
jgi:hypothetical protein